MKMSFNLSQRREAEVLGFEFVDPLESVYPLRPKERRIEVEVDYEIPELEKSAAELVPVVPVEEPTSWKLSAYGFYETVLKNGLRVILYQTAAQPSVQVQTV